MCAVCHTMSYVHKTDDVPLLKIQNHFPPRPKILDLETCYSIAQRPTVIGLEALESPKKPHFLSTPPHSPQTLLENRS